MSIFLLDEDTFRPILDDERSSIIVTSNKIACDCKMKWLVSDSHNYIDRVHGLVCGGYEQKGKNPLVLKIYEI